MSDWVQQRLNEVLPTYKAFIALSQHFKAGSNYDYFQYDGQVRASTQSLKKNPQLKMFFKLHNKHANDIVPFLVAQFMENSRLAVADCLNISAEKIYASWKQKNSIIALIVYSDIKHLYKTHSIEKVTDLFRILSPGVPSPLLSAFYEGSVSLHTIVALDRIFRLVEHWDMYFAGDFVWDHYKAKIQQVSGFIDVDTDAVRTALVKVVKGE